MTATASTLAAGIVGKPVANSLSPVVHGAWIEAAKLDATYFVAELARDGFRQFALERGPAPGLGRADILGFNITAPFKEEALALAHQASDRARRAGAANLLLYRPGGELWADNTDGEGLLAAFAEQTPGFDPAAGPAVIIGAGGAARGAAAAFLGAGAPAVRIVNRSAQRAAAMADDLGELVTIVPQDAMSVALADANAVINATPVAPEIPLGRACASPVVMDMVYRPLITPFLASARTAGLKTVDGLAMLIGQARPSFRAFFGVEPPDEVDVRAKVIEFLALRGPRS